MAYTILGLGNPGPEYAKTRHNAGRMVAELLAKGEEMEFIERKAAEALVAEGKIGKEKAVIALPETFMNKSGRTALKLVKGKKAAAQLLVIRDDLDLPLGVTKMTFARGAGGHKGVESIMRALKTEEFAQLKIGISAMSAKGVARKVAGEEKVNKFVVGKFSPKEDTTLKKVLKKAALVARLFVTDGVEKATMEANTR